MENGVFGNAPINQFDFQGDANGDGLMQRLPAEILKSSVVENLLAQNEDLMARIKVALRRLDAIETENRNLAREAAEARQHAASAEDHSLVFREKDQILRDKAAELQRRLETAENENRRLAREAEEIPVLRETEEILRRRMVEAQTKAEHLEREFRTRSESLEREARRLESEVARYRKYHDRIRTQVKPHLIELREYARGLEEKCSGLQTDLERREGQVRDLRHQISEVTKNSRYQVEQAETRMHDVINSYESTIASQRRELESAREIVSDLETKALKLPRAEQRRDELENEVIELRRSKEEMSARFEHESRRQLERAEFLSGESARLKIENEDLKTKTMTDYDRIRELEKQTLDQQSQLESLRFMYNSRTEESERLKAALSALERLNVDLSAKFQELKAPSSGSSGSGTGEAESRI